MADVNAPSKFDGLPQSVEEFWNEKDGPPLRQVTAMVVGFGNRGEGYASFSIDFPSRLKIVAVAEKLERRRFRAREKFNLNETCIFSDWKDLLEYSSKNGKMADCVIIATQDKMHKEPAIAFAKQGYHLLLEKPMSTSESECEEIAKACIENNIICAVCHVLRYFPPVIKIKEIIDSGVLGEIVTIDHFENIGFYHFAHSFVRGNWKKESTSTFSLLAKSCHDVDLLQYWMGDKKCIQVQSFGGLHHFKPEKAPKGSGLTCLECPKEIESACPYSALKIYNVDCDPPVTRPRWPASVVCDIEDDPRGYNAALKDALKDGPYGRCVYKSDNDVSDHQVVNMVFEGGATVSFTMNAFTPDIRRETRICGSLGELRWDGSARNDLVLNIFNEHDRSGQATPKYIKPDMYAPPVKTGGHEGADFFLMNAFVKSMAEGKSHHIGTGVEGSLSSHKLVFAAEESRKNQGKVIKL